MKYIKYLLVLVLSLTLFTGCIKDNKELNIGDTLASSFKSEISKNKDILKVAEKLSKNEVIEVAVEAVELNDGDYMPGFTDEIKDYKKVAIVRPFIGTIPFVMYIFETENPKELAKTLEEKADLRWNICTEADIMKIEVSGNYVFFVMTPEKF